jgi:hypothetical protein
MSNDSYVVECIVDPQSLKLPAADFEARIIEPMVARLRQCWKNWDQPFVHAHLRMTVAPISQDLLDTLYAGDEE